MVPLANGLQGFLYGVAFLSQASGWAVGYSCVHDCSGGAEKTLIERRQRGSWVRVPSPSPGPLEGLFSVSAASATNAWAVGTYVAIGPAGLFRTLIVHWDGTKWSRVPSPDPSPDHQNGLNVITAVSALSARNAWAAGYYCVRNCQQDGEVDRTLILHWNGSEWSRVPSPNPVAGVDTLKAISAVSASDAWAVGTYGARSENKTLILHWNGTSWSTVRSPNPRPGDNELTAVAATSASAAWAAGFFCPVACAGFNTRSHTLILRWNGSRWSVVPTPNPSNQNSVLASIASVSPRDAWAAGFFCVRHCAPPQTDAEVDHSLILHWNGSRWAAIPSPHPGSGGSELTAVSAVSRAMSWAAGFACSTPCGGSQIDVHPLILRWNGTRWIAVRIP